MSSARTAITAIRPSAQPPAPRGLPRLLVGIRAAGPMGIEEHHALHGPLALERGGRRGQLRDRAALLIEEIDRAGLLGRGGAAFPTASKLRAVAGARGRAIVLANGAEGEPASLKDRTLLESLPHLVLDGAALAAQATGADEVIVCACETAGSSVASVQRAIAERDASQIATGAARVRLAVVPSHYVAGQESALVNFLGGGPAKPTFTPPLPFEQGVMRRPTLVDNVETLAHISLIARHGAPWFRELGIATQPGSALITLSGPVAYPGVYEVEHGASLASLIEAGGGTSAPVRAALFGGYCGAWIGAERLAGVALSKEHLAPHGATLGAGVVALLSQEACPIAETARVARWMAGQSARQCGPCINGLDAIASSLDEILAGVAHPQVTKRLQRLASLTARRGACAHPDGALNLVLSAMEVFAPELADHARHGPCAACQRPAELPLPERAVSDQRQRRSARA